MDTKHTPGPWVLIEDAGGAMILRRARKAHPCDMRQENPIVAVTTPTGSVQHRPKFPRRPPRYRLWDGGPVPPGCNGRIESGATYAEYVGETPAYQSGHRFCLACSVAAGIIAKGPGAGAAATGGGS